MSLLLGAAALLVVSTVIFVVGGVWLSARSHRGPGRVDRTFARAVRRCNLLHLAACAVAFGAVLLLSDRLPGAVRAGLLYALPLYWFFLGIVGSSWLEIRLRDNSTPLLRFSRFNLFAAYLLQGQRLPFLSAAFAAPVDPEGGATIVGGAAFHFFLALLLGLILRWWVVHRVARLRPFPDRAMFDDLQRTARRVGTTLHDVVLVPTEPGQAVNAIAATSSRTLYAAEGLFVGLDRPELRAVLLHELGHLTQTFTNSARNLSVVGTPAVIYALRLLPDIEMEPSRRNLVLGALTVGWLLAFFFGRLLWRSAERQADRFAERHGEHGALASALRKLFEQRGFSPSDLRSDPSLHRRLDRLDISPPLTP